MARTVGIGVQDFARIITEDIFYVDKTHFIKEWWESGYGRYDVMLEPRDLQKNAFILEFKVYNPRKESSIEKTVEAALQQIEEKRYEEALIEKGISKENIYKYGFAFEGKNVLIG